jgi:DNA-binding NarL/FixJ family response regulator
MSSTRQQTTIASAHPASLPKLTDTQRRVLIALCRPYQDAGSFATPASNREIAGELFLTVDAVKMHLRSLFARLELTGLPQNQKRARLAECALRLGLVTQRDLG